MPTFTPNGIPLPSDSTNQPQVEKAFRSVDPYLLRTTAAATVYVDDATGDDNNDGLTALTALATVQAAINHIKLRFDLRGPSSDPIIIQVADSTYTSSSPIALVSGPFVGQQQATNTFPSNEESPLLIRGNVANPEDVIFHSTGNLAALLVVWGAQVSIEGVTLICDAGNCMFAGGGGGITFGNCILGAAGATKILSAHGSIIENYDDFSISGNSLYVLDSDWHGSIGINHECTLLGNITCTAFARSAAASDLTATGFTVDLNGFTVTGKRFEIEGGTIDTGTNDPNFFPGTVAGTSVGFGSYDNNHVLSTGHLNVSGFPTHAHASYLTAVDLGGNAVLSSATGRTGSNVLHQSVNAFLDATDWKHISTGLASNYYQFEGAHVFRSAPSAAAAAVSVWTDRMIVNPSGVAVPNGNVNLSLSSFLSHAATQTAIQVGGNGVIASNIARGASKAVSLGHNTYFNGTNDTYISTDSASRVFLGFGLAILQVAVSGTAGTTATFIGAVRASATRVGIFNDTPRRPLDVLSTSEPQARLTHTDNTHFADFTVSGAGDLTIAPSGGDVSITGTLSATSFTVSGLTAGRVPFAGSGGLLTDDADLTFATDTLTSTKLVGSTSVSTPSLIAAADLTAQPTGDWIFNAGGKDILPSVNYDQNLGALSKKYLTLHAAELWVETLVAQDTSATIGGRILVGPTTILIADVGIGDTTIDVKHNQMASGDRVYMEAFTKVEFMAITSGATVITGGYRYSVTRNLDGTGANVWYAGDAVFNTGTTGSGFIDIYSMRGVKAGTEIGPTIVGNIRNSSTFNDWSSGWAIGNLNGVYGYGSNTHGVAFGKYIAGQTRITIDVVNGFKIINGLSTTLGQWDISGVVTVGEVGVNKSNVLISAGTLSIRNNTTVLATWQSSGDIIIGEVGASKSNTLISAGALSMRLNTTSLFNIDTSGNVTLGNVATDQGNAFWNNSNKRLEFRGGTAGTVVQCYIDTAGAFTTGKVQVDLNGVQLVSATTSGFDSSRAITNVSSLGGGILSTFYDYNDPLEAEHQTTLRSNPITGRGSILNLHAWAPTGQAASVEMSAYVNSVPQASVGVDSSTGFTVFTGGAQRLEINNSGNVGISPSVFTPADLVHIRKDQNLRTALIVDNQTSGTASSASILTQNASGLNQFGVYSAATNAYGAIAAATAFFYTNTVALTVMVDNASGVIKFATGGNAEKMRLDAGGRLGIGVTPDTSSALRVDSTTGAFLPPRMTTTQRDALTAADGHIIYNTTTGALNYRKAGAWVAI